MIQATCLVIEFVKYSMKSTVHILRDYRGNEFPTFASKSDWEVLFNNWKGLTDNLYFNDPSKPHIIFTNSQPKKDLFIQRWITNLFLKIFPDNICLNCCNNFLFRYKNKCNNIWILTLSRVFWFCSVANHSEIDKKKTIDTVLDFYLNTDTISTAVIELTQVLSLHVPYVCKK